LEYEGEHVWLCGRQINKESGRDDVYVGAEWGTCRGKPGKEGEVQFFWMPGEAKLPASLYKF
jgi:hypothetical protein